MASPATEADRIPGYTLAESEAIRRRTAEGKISVSRSSRPGPKRDENLLRTKSGRPSRSKRAKASRAASETEQAFLARARVFGLTPAQARLPEAASALGRMYVRGSISLDQYLAGDLVRERADDARRALDLNAPTDYVKIGGDPDDRSPLGLGEVSDEYVRWARKALDRMAEVRRVLKDVCAEERSRTPEQAVNMVVLDDTEAPALVGPLRSALNAVNRRLVQNV